MPAARVECCGQTFTLEEALAHVAARTNRCEWTWELLSAVLESQTAHPSSRDASRISTTALTTKCLRQVALERNNDYTVAPSALWATFRGSQFHGFLEAHAHPASYGEARFHVRDLGVQIPAVRDRLPDADRAFSGSPDLVDPTDGLLADYKRTKEVPRFNDVWPDHRAQNNINRWLVDHADYVELKEAKRPDKDAPGLLSVSKRGADGTYECEWDLSVNDVRARFVPAVWRQLVIIYADDKGPKPITCTESLTVTGKNGRPKRVRSPEIWDDEKVEAYIVERYAAARVALTAGIAPIPTGWEFQSHVLCGYCAVRRLCAQQERREYWAEERAVELRAGES